MDATVEVYSQAIYDEIFEAATSANLVGSCSMESKALVNSKYKTVAKKVRPVAKKVRPMTIQLPHDINDHVQQVGKEPRVRDARKIGHKFTEETMAKD
jgi:hypothetical protein